MFSKFKLMSWKTCCDTAWFRHNGSNRAVTFVTEAVEVVPVRR